MSYHVSYNNQCYHNYHFITIIATVLYISIAIPIGMVFIVLFAVLLTLAACFMWKKSKQSSFDQVNILITIKAVCWVEDICIFSNNRPNEQQLGVHVDK